VNAPLIDGGVSHPMLSQIDMRLGVFHLAALLLERLLRVVLAVEFEHVAIFFTLVD
jgi:hypothetical protein